jgi:hypothetical protein
MNRAVRPSSAARQALLWCLLAALALGCPEPPKQAPAEPGSSELGSVGASASDARPAAARPAALPGALGEGTGAPGSGPSGADSPSGVEAADVGDFVLRYVDVEDPDNREVEATLRESRLFERSLSDLNETVALPKDVYVVLRECGEPNSFYNPAKEEIVVCYELVRQFAEQFHSRAGDSYEEHEAAEQSIAGATLFIFYHEAGHAVIDLYDLPVVGREEDAVDQLATLVLLERGGKEGERAALDSATTFLAEGHQALDQMAFWDEHSLDRQRFFSLLCWVYGKAPEEHQDLIGEETLPPARAERCPAEYRRMARAWKRLLDPYLKG